MNTVILDVLRAFGLGLGFEDILPSEDGQLIHLQCSNGDVIGFRLIEEELLCFVRRHYRVVVLDALWASIFLLVNAEEWRARQWHVGLRGEDTLELFTFLPGEGLGTEELNSLFGEMWQLRDALSQL